MSVYPCHPCIPLFFMVIFVSLKEQFAWDSVWGRDTSDIHIPAQGWIHMLEHRWLVSSGLSQSETSAWPGGVLAQQLWVHQDYLGTSVPELLMFEQLTQSWVSRLPRKTSATASEVSLEWLHSLTHGWFPALESAAKAPGHCKGSLHMCLLGAHLLLALRSHFSICTLNPTLCVSPFVFANLILKGAF